MTLEEQCKLSYYKKIADISTHTNVFLVQHVENNRIFVMKEQTVYSREVYEHLKTCENPHIPKIYECVEDEENQKLIIVEEYIQGESLADHLQEKGVYSLEETCRFMITVCDVLEELHNLPQPVIHRDLKPDNILIQENGYLKIIDFNSAKQFETGRDSDTVIIGTRKYAAPEQFGFRQSDARTDIYAIGVMMNYLLTRHYPDEEIYHSDLCHEKQISDIIRKCTQFAPDSRYQTAVELRRDLQIVLAELTDQKVAEMKDKDEVKVREDQEEKETTGSESEHWNVPFLPVGFRTGSIWKMCLAAAGYAFFFWMDLTMTFTRSDGQPVTALYNWQNRIAILVWVLLSIAFWGNYLGFRRRLPLMKKKYMRWLGIFLWPFIFLVIVLIVLAIVE